MAATQTQLNSAFLGRDNDADTLARTHTRTTLGASVYSPNTKKLASRAARLSIRRTRSRNRRRLGGGVGRCAPKESDGAGRCDFCFFRSSAASATRTRLINLNDVHACGGVSRRIAVPVLDFVVVHDTVRRGLHVDCINDLIGRVKRRSKRDAQTLPQNACACIPWDTAHAMTTVVSTVHGLLTHAHAQTRSHTRTHAYRQASRQASTPVRGQCGCTASQGVRS